MLPVTLIAGATAVAASGSWKTAAPGTLQLITTVAVRLPRTVGEKRTLNHTFQPVRNQCGIRAERHLEVAGGTRLRSGPTAFRSTGASPIRGSKIVKVWVTLWPTATVPNCTLVAPVRVAPAEFVTRRAGAGAALATGGILSPVPATANTSEAIPRALLLTVTVAVRLPTPCGEKLMLKVALPPGWIVVTEG